MPDPAESGGDTALTIPAPHKGQVFSLQRAAQERVKSAQAPWYSPAPGRRTDDARSAKNGT